MRRMLFATVAIFLVWCGSAFGAAAIDVSVGTDNIATATGTVDTAAVVEFKFVDGEAACPGRTEYSSPYVHQVSGAFSVRQGYGDKTPGRTFTVCAMLADYRGGKILATARRTFTNCCPVPPPPPPPPPPERRPILLAPDDGVSGELLNPTFVWLGRDPDADVCGRDRISVARVNSDNTIQLLHDVHEGPSNNDCGDGADEVARWTTTGGSVTDTRTEVQFFRPFAPGTYEWWVGGGRWVSQRRRFVVLAPHLSLFALRVVSEPGRSSDAPGRSRVLFDATRYTKVTVTISRSNRRDIRVFHMGAEENGGFAIRWSCDRPGGRYRISAEATDQYGATRQATRSFRPVSRTRCRQLRAREAALRRASARRRAQQERARRQADARRRAAALQRFKSNCRKLGGTPVLLQSIDGPEWYCRAPGGGFLPVPQ